MRLPAAEPLIIKSIKFPQAMLDQIKFACDQEYIEFSKFVRNAVRASLNEKATKKV